MKIIIEGVQIKTNKYTGNFEREMTAYCTGKIGDCGVGKRESDQYFTVYEKPIQRVSEVPDEHGVFRPVVIDSDANNLIIVFNDDYEIPSEDIETIKSRAIEYGNKIGVEILGFETGKFIVKR